MAFADAKQRFSNRVADYVRYRPSYPAALLDLLRKKCALNEKSVIADTGSGTGLLSQLFLKNGNRVFGVEPNQEMREAGERFLRDYKNFTSVNGSAETTNLPDASVDFITAAQAFHWFEPNATRKEFSRILHAEGWVVALWNDRRILETQFGRDLEDLIVRLGIDYISVKDAYPDCQNMRNFFGDGNFSFHELPNAQMFDFNGLVGRVRSSSYAPTEGHANYVPMMAELEKIFRTHQVNGQVHMEYTTQIYCGQLR